MKQGIHPDYRTVVFHDTSVDKYFLIGSTLQTDRTIEWGDGKTYPYMTVEVSSESHPYYTGKQRVVHKEGRVANFSRKFGNLGSKKSQGDNS
ncbi:type B 50S ribosomal protein L31 [Vibrio amylolyticus]|uniref:type B 50S ribosomal protein L31 n=1 Tax=Vibrio amylolyticus TaxID=2847292 RepID=UPI00354E72FC